MAVTSSDRMKLLLDSSTQRTCNQNILTMVSQPVPLLRFTSYCLDVHGGPRLGSSDRDLVSPHLIFVTSIIRTERDLARSSLAPHRHHGGHYCSSYHRLCVCDCIFEQFRKCHYPCVRPFTLRWHR